MNGSITTSYEGHWGTATVILRKTKIAIAVNIGLCSNANSNNRDNTMTLMTTKILNDNWYVTASSDEMRVALMHLQQESMDNLTNQTTQRYKQVRETVLDACRNDLGWQ